MAHGPGINSFAFKKVTEQERKSVSRSSSYFSRRTHQYKVCLCYTVFVAVLPSADRLDDLLLCRQLAWRSGFIHLRLWADDAIAIHVSSILATSHCRWLADSFLKTKRKEIKKRASEGALLCCRSLFLQTIGYQAEVLNAHMHVPQGSSTRDAIQYGPPAYKTNCYLGLCESCGTICVARRP